MTAQRKIHPSMTTPFELLREPEWTDKAVFLVLKTDSGPMTLWAPKWTVNLYRYRENDREILQAWVQDWLLKKAGIVPAPTGG